MRIGIDARFAIRQRRGIGTYALNLIRWLAKIDRENEYFLYVDRKDVERVLPQQDNFHLRKFCLPIYPVWEQIAFPILAAVDRLDVVHSVGNTGPLFLLRRVRRVTSVMDVMYLKDSRAVPPPTSNYQRLGRMYRRLVVPTVARASNAVITISEFSRSDILRHISGLSPENLHVTYLAHDEPLHKVDPEMSRTRLADKYSLRGEYILCLGAEDPRKNTHAVVRAYLTLRSCSDIREKLVIVGLRNWRSSKCYEDFRLAGELKSVYFFDFVDAEDMTLLYNSAKVFLYPSLYEGFGLPILEAMACGVPVITSNRTSMPEVAGDAAFLVDPLDSNDLVNALKRVLADSALRTDMARQGIQRASLFSWRRLAEQTLAVYESVMP